MIDLLVKQYIKSKIDDKFGFMLGAAVMQHIKERTLLGLDKDDKPFKPYSTKPFALPFAALPKYAVRRLKAENNLGYTRRNGVLFAIVMSGYAKYKALRYSITSYDGEVNLNLTGSMMRSFVVLRFDSEKVVLGFNRKQAAAVYYFNTLRGRDMLGITAKNLVAIFEKLI